jgi:hypothetical protein
MEGRTPYLPTPSYYVGLRQAPLPPPCQTRSVCESDVGELVLSKLAASIGRCPSP